MLSVTQRCEALHDGVRAALANFGVNLAEAEVNPPRSTPGECMHVAIVLRGDASPEAIETACGDAAELIWRDLETLGDGARLCECSVGVTIGVTIDDNADDEMNGSCSDQFTINWRCTPSPARCSVGLSLLRSTYSPATRDAIETVATGLGIALESDDDDDDDDVWNAWLRSLNLQVFKKIESVKPPQYVLQTVPTAEELAQRDRNWAIAAADTGLAAAKASYDALTPDQKISIDLAMTMSPF